MLFLQPQLPVLRPHLLYHTCSVAYGRGVLQLLDYQRHLKGRLMQDTSKVLEGESKAEDGQLSVCAWIEITFLSTSPNAYCRCVLVFSKTLSVAFSLCCLSGS